MIDRTLLIVGWMFVIGFLVQAIPFSALAIDVDGVIIEGDQVIASRSFPMDRVGADRPWVSYTETVRPLTPGHNGGRYVNIEVVRLNTPVQKQWVGGLLIGRRIALMVHWGSRG